MRAGATPYGLVLGTGFLLSPVVKAMGAGVFGLDFGAKMAVTVYLAHLCFGAILGLLAHRFARGLEPLWTPTLKLVRPSRDRADTT